MTLHQIVEKRSNGFLAGAIETVIMLVVAAGTLGMVFSFLSSIAFLPKDNGEPGAATDAFGFSLVAHFEIMATLVLLIGLSLGGRYFYRAVFLPGKEMFDGFYWINAAGAAGRVVDIYRGGTILTLRFPSGKHQDYRMDDLVQGPPLAA